MTDWIVASALVLLSACGPDGGSPSSGSDGEGESSGVQGTGSDTGVVGSSSTGTPAGCTEFVDGDLEITDATDLVWVRSVREVTGNVYIQNLTTAEDLSMLACLEVVGDGVLVVGTQKVRSLHGLERLRSVGDWPDSRLFFEGNTALESLAGLDNLEEVARVTLWDNPNLSRLELNRVKRLGSMMLGWVECVPPSRGGVAMPRGDNPKLTALDGFEGLESGASFGVFGQSGLVSLDRLVELAELREAEPGLGEHISATFELNTSLSVGEISRYTAVLGVLPPFSPELVCGNKGDPNTCVCESGE